MIRIFKTNGILQIVIILAVSVAVCGKNLIAPPEMACDATCGPIYLLLHKILSGSPLIAAILALLLTLIEGYLLNRLLYNKGLIPLNSLMPTLLYVMLMGVGVETYGLSPALLTNLWLLLSLNSLMPKESLIVPENCIFNTTMWFSMAVMTWLPALFAALPIIAGLLSYKVYKGREWSVALLGFLALIIIVATILFLIDRMDIATNYAVSSIGELHIFCDTETLAIAETALFAIMAIYCTISSVSSLYRNTIAQRRHGLVIVSMLVYSLSSLFYTKFMPINAQPFAITVATAGSICLLGRKRRLWIYDIAMAILFFLSLYSYL